MLSEITVTFHVNSSIWAALILLLLLPYADASPRALSLPGDQRKTGVDNIPEFGSRHRRQDVRSAYISAG